MHSLLHISGTYFSPGEKLKLHVHKFPDNFISKCFVFPELDHLIMLIMLYLKIARDFLLHKFALLKWILYHGAILWYPYCHTHGYRRSFKCDYIGDIIKWCCEYTIDCFLGLCGNGKLCTSHHQVDVQRISYLQWQFL